MELPNIITKLEVSKEKDRKANVRHNCRENLSKVVVGKLLITYNFEFAPLRCDCSYGYRDEIVSTYIFLVLRCNNTSYFWSKPHSDLPEL